MSWAPFWVAKVVGPTQSCNCTSSPTTKTITIAAGASAKVGVTQTLCQGVEASFEVAMEVNASISESVTVPPCKCVAFVHWRQVAISAETRDETQWVCLPGNGAAGTGAPGAYPVVRPVRRLRVRYLTPASLPPVPHEFPIVTPCSHCPGSPAPIPGTQELSPPPAVVAQAGTTDDRVTYFDFSNALKPLEIQSLSDMSLFELRGAVQRLTAEALAYPEGWVDVTINDHVGVKGKTVAVIEDLKKLGDTLRASARFGDFNQDGARSIADYALLTDAVFGGAVSERTASRMDLNADGRVDQQDVDAWLSLQ